MELGKKIKKQNIVLFFSCIVAAIYFVMFIYSDITETTRHGITFWNALATGHLKDFYVMNTNITVSECFGTSIAAIYDIPVYLVFAIWNLPLWIYEKMSGLNALDSMVGLLWAKAISIPFMLGIHLCIIKIGKLVKGETYPVIRSLMMLLSSVFFLTPILIMGQYDAMALFFMMLGVYYYIKGNQRFFVMWFAIAMPFKMFALFIFIPLVLLKEKRVRYILLQGVGGCSFLVLCKLVQKFYFTPNDVGTDYMSGHLLTFIFQSQIGFAYGSISLFIVVFGMVCLYCYFKKTPADSDLGKWAIYVCCLGLVSFFVTSLTHPQWSLLLLPFVILLVCCKDTEQMKNGLLIETVSSTGLLLAQVIYYYWVFNIKTSVYTLAGKLFYDGKKAVEYSIRELIGNILSGIDINYLNMIGGGIFVAGIVFFLYWGNPDTKCDRFAQTELSYENIIVLRLLIMGMLGLALIVLML